MKHLRRLLPLPGILLITLACGKGPLDSESQIAEAVDFVVLSRDLFAIDPVEIPEVDVLGTVIGGERVFASDVLGN